MPDNDENTNKPKDAGGKEHDSTDARPEDESGEQQGPSEERSDSPAKPLKPTPADDWVKSDPKSGEGPDAELLKQALLVNEAMKKVMPSDGQLAKTAEAWKRLTLSPGQISNLSTGASATINKLMKDSAGSRIFADIAKQNAGFMKNIGSAGLLADKFMRNPDLETFKLPPIVDYKAEAEARHRAQVEVSQTAMVEALTKIIAQNDADSAENRNDARWNRWMNIAIVVITAAALTSSIFFGVRSCGSNSSGARATPKAPSVTASASSATH